MKRYRFSNLTAALTATSSPLRTYLRTHFPHVRAVQDDHRRERGALLVTPGRADPATLGSAFDLGVRFCLDPAYVPQIASYGFAGLPACLDTIADLVGLAQQGSRATTGRSGDGFARACWVLALTTAVYREGGVPPDSPLVRPLRQATFTPSVLQSLVPADGVRQLLALRELADARLLPHLHPPYALGPTFAASRYCNADADLIADGLLLDLKTRLGARSAHTGVRSDTLRGLDLYQLLGYALFDTDDAHTIRSVGIYSARYGRLTTWPLADLMATMAGHPVDLAAARRDVLALLTDG